MTHVIPSRSAGPGRRVFRRAAAVIGLMLAGCTSDEAPGPAGVATIQGTVATSWGEAVRGARVYFVPADQIVTTAITAGNVLDAGSDGFDEPFEDLIPGTAAAGFPQAVTDATGRYAVADLDTTRQYFIYVDPAGAMPAALYPGGSLCRVARSGSALEELTIELTGGPSPGTAYIGSSQCFTCHPAYEGQKTHAHRLGFRVPGVSTAAQDLSRFPTFDAGLAFFPAATAATFKTAGTALWCYDYDATRDTDKFKLATTDPGGTTREIKVYLWRDTGDANKYKISMENLVNVETDRTFEVGLTYGGALYRQLYLLRIPSASYKGRYPFLQFQHEGDNTLYERTRKSWRDHGIAEFWNATTKVFKDPTKTRNVESECMGCHATGYRVFTDATTGERMCDAADDGAGDIDIDGDGTRDEINTGCEACHGPGGEHVFARSPRAIIKPQNLPPERQNMICGRCHDRPLGNDGPHNTQALNANQEFALPGIRRAIWLRDYTSRRGPALTDLWPDAEHSLSHYQQYSDFIKSSHYRNDRRLVVCTDCHDVHGTGAGPRDLKGDPDTGTLCATCHAIDVAPHVQARTGSNKAGAATSCNGCHWSKVAKSGAGRPSFLLGSSATSDDDTYFRNDITSHLTRVPNKRNTGVAGRQPGKAMPVPYTNGCSAPCHDVRFLRY